MSTLETIFLALIQGLTEFLPISSSAHLIIPSQVLGWKDQGQAFDVAVHVGTLLAVLLYFKDELIKMAGAWFCSVSQRKQTTDSLLAWWLIVATIPAGLFGFLFKDFIEENLRSALVIAATTIIFGVLLGFADKKATQQRVIEHICWKDALIIGFCQALAMIPGTSRSGITITAGLMLGLDRQSAARFSFLMSIPIITLAGGYHAVNLVLSDTAVDWRALIIGSVLSFGSALACIHYFLMFVERVGMTPFVIYRLILGFGLLIFAL